MNNVLGIILSPFFLNIPTFSQLSTDNLIDCWPFYGNAIDSVGNNNGIVNGATLIIDRFGNARSAYYFDGTTNSISFLFENAIDINTKSTIMLWFKAAEVQEMYCKLLCVPFSLDSWNNPYHYLAFSGTAF
jgi:hypothetical protein